VVDLGGERMTVFAHAGHWLVSMVYAAPALLLAGALVVSTIRQRRREAERRAAAALDGPSAEEPDTGGRAVAPGAASERPHAD
jgi:hypothetical protein